jgi:hypothetical protein
MGGRLPRAAAEAAANVTPDRQNFSLKGTNKKSVATHPPAQQKENRACLASPMMWQAGAWSRNGRRRVMGGSRGRGGLRPASCLLVVVCCVLLWDFLYSIGSYAQLCGIFGQICPTMHPTIPPKNNLAEVGFLRLHTQDAHTK